MEPVEEKIPELSSDSELSEQSIEDKEDNQEFDSDDEELDDFGLQSSRWQAQIGLRYIFN